MNRDNLPTLREIGRELPDLPKVKLNGYDDINEYVSTYYELTRADFVSMIQKGLEQHRADRGKVNPPRNYELTPIDVTFGHQVPETSGVSWQVHFDPKKVLLKQFNYY